MNISQIKLLILIDRFRLSSNIDLESLVKLLPQSSSVTGADLYGICSKAWLNAARRIIRSAQESGE